MPITVHGIRVQNGDPIGRWPGEWDSHFRLPGAGTYAALARGMSFRPKVAVSFPPTQESKVLADWLSEDGFEPIGLSSHTRLEHELTHSPVKLLVVDAAFAVAAINVVRVRHPLLPIVVVGDADPSAEAYAKTRGALYLTRPVDRAVFSCTMAMTMADSLPIRRSERVPTRLSVVVHGVASQLIDISKDGMRIEMTRRQVVPPPMFDVVVPMLGVKINVRRMWTGKPPLRADAVWYGGELSNNSTRTELAWHTLVDTLARPRASVKLQ
jgi:hypothetical protein